MAYSDPVRRAQYHQRYWAALTPEVKAGYRANQRAYRQAKLSPEAKAARAASRAEAARARVIQAHREAKGMLNPSGERPDGPCEICGTEGRLYLDHSHITGYVRGWLCNRCNAGLGLFQDSPDNLRAAADYIERTI